MTWGRIDDRLDDDPRFLAASPAALGVWLMLLPRALREDTDGTIPDPICRRHHRVCTQLHRIGLLVEDGGRTKLAPDLWAMLQMPPEIRLKRQQAARARWHPSKGNANAMQMHSKSNAVPVPVPVPVNSKLPTGTYLWANKVLPTIRATEPTTLCLANAFWTVAFWETATRGEGCWTWGGRTNSDGYGRWEGAEAYRVAFCLFHRLLPIELRGFDIHHVCHNRLCVNPEHLERRESREHRLETYDPAKDKLQRSSARADVQAVWEAWVASTRRERCHLDDKRKARIQARLREYPLADVIDAVRGWERDPWEGRRQQNELAILLRDGAQLEKFRDLQRKPSVNGLPTHGPSPLELEYLRRDKEARQ